MAIVQCPNKEIGRRGLKPLAFVIHRTEGNYFGARQTILDATTQKSYHFMIAETGMCEQFVDTKDTAWHAGLVVNSTWPLLSNGSNPNQYTIGIALSGMAETKPTIEQMAKCANIIKEWAKFYNITLDKNSIIPHHSIRQDKACPGQFVDTGVLLYLATLA